MAAPRARSLVIVAAAIFLVALFVSSVWASAQARNLLQATATPAGGVNIKITGVSIPNDRKPVVTFRLADDAGRPLQLSDVDQGSVRFTIARLETDTQTSTTQWVNFVTGTVQGRPYQFEGQTMQPVLPQAIQVLSAMDSTGQFAAMGSDGTHTYTFVTVLPENYPKDVTYAVGAQATREARRWASNDVFYFVPAGGQPTANRQVVTNQACNTCHDQLQAHGGQRVDVALCSLCHTPQSTDPETGNTVDYGPMIHRLHNGANLPSVKEGKPYVLVGFGQSVFNFSRSRWPQDIRNCQTCHTGPQGDVWKTAPTQWACSSCHDNMNAATGQNHSPGAYPDTTCKGCHVPSMAQEFDISVPGSHFLPTFSSQLRGVQFTLQEVTDTGRGQRPKVRFQIKDRAGAPIPPANMTRLAFTLAGSTSDYSRYWNEQVTANQASDLGGGTYEYTFNQAIPQDATGSYAVGIEGYIEGPINGFGGRQITVRDAGFNRVLYAPVTDRAAQPRKQIVTQQNCNACHLHLGDPAGLSVHGGFRRNVEYCLLCHNSTTTDAARRPPDRMPPVTVHMKPMIHRIHAGEEGAQPYTVYGFGGTAIDFSRIVYPGRLANCQKCHIPNSQYLNFMQKGAQPTVVRQGDNVVSIVQPVTSACTSCHDSWDAVAHANLQTTQQGVESCRVCHQEGRDAAVGKVHQQK